YSKTSSVNREQGSSRILPPRSLDLKQNYNASTGKLQSLESPMTISSDLRQDLSMMEQRKRVTQTLQSPVFKDELECLVREQNSKCSGLFTLSHIADLIINNTLTHTTAHSYNGVGSVSPVNDVCGLEWFSKAETQSRCKLASLYRLLDLYGYEQFTNAYITVRLGREQDHFLILPRGLSFSEATAASLMKVNLIGQVLEHNSTGLDVDEPAFKLHAVVYSARPDAKCVIHTHTPATAAVSSMKCGILPISHEALLLGEVTYFTYHGEINDGQERVDLQKALGPNAKVLVLRNHGILTFGETIEEAFHYAYHCKQACEIQVSALSCAGGVENLHVLDRESVRLPPLLSAGQLGDGQIRWSVGEAEFESLMRMLDSLGYRTGYAYRHPLLKIKPNHHNDVEIPATVTGVGQEEQEVFPWSSYPLLGQRRDRGKMRWLNSPNSYMKVHIQENLSSGIFSPHTRTMWMKSEESGSCTDTPIKIEDPNQFVPLNTNPTEVLEKRNKIREQNRVDLMTAGPKSQLLANIVIDTPPGPAFIYEDEEEMSSLPPNPFSQSETELQEYTQIVENKLNQSEAEDVTDVEEMTTYDGSTISLSFSPLKSPEKEDTLLDLLHNGEDELLQDDDITLQVTELSITKEMQVSITSTVADNIPDSGPIGSQSKSPQKKKKKFRTPSFLKMSKKKGKERGKGKEKESEKVKEKEKMTEKEKEREEEKERN
uniref:Class II aldolase/adducin N-terminal domain-containing protein n=1 Tax=Electrophorus electricus TaxID=8005 RepID=A0A4W4H1Y1_ELEEL